MEWERFLLAFKVCDYGLTPVSKHSLICQLLKHNKTMTDIPLV